ncbi:MAG TPA: hypothetical protein VGT44_17865 [Ktedonobacteraceae bacterium]|nr:hypothetical protein [Ktedonobacteraceae bacterium]
MRLPARLFRQRALLLLTLLLLLALLAWRALPASITLPANAAPRRLAPLVGTLTGGGTWHGAQDDLLYVVAFSSAQQPYGPLVVYRAFGTDLSAALPILIVPRSPLNLTPVLYPSPDGRALALLNPLSTGYNNTINGASLSIVSTYGTGSTMLAQHVALADPPIWTSDSRAVYYMTGDEINQEIHRVDLSGHDTMLYRQSLAQGSMRLVGLDRSGALIITLARPNMPVTIERLNAGHATTPTPVITLPPDILPGNVLRVGSDGASLVYTRATGAPFQVAFATHIITIAAPLFDSSRYDHNLVPLAISSNGTILAMSQVVSIRSDLAAQGIANMPEQERLLLVNASGSAWQALQLPDGGQLLQAFWTGHVNPAKVHAASLPGRQRASNGPEQNGTVYQQDLWMLEGHANQLFDGPKLPTMCYGLCSSPNGAPHISAAILHGVAYTESDWHQFNSSDFHVNGEQVGSPLESFDGGWGEYQQTWGMPPQCKAANNCRSDVYRIEHDQAYNIGVGIQSLIHAWNSTAGVVSSSDPNDPYKANDWFFAVWAYNGSYGNNPNDVPSSQYGHWYPGAPFNSIYEERVWYFAAHPQSASTGWTDNYVPSLGPALLPPQADFVKTSDSFVDCVTCSIPDWTSGSYDREWVGYGAPNAQAASSFTTAFAQLGGENALGLPRDNGGGAAAHRWGSGLAQDFGGGSDQPGTLLLADNTTTAYFVYGSLWTQYLVADHGAPGCHGYPTSNLFPFSDPGLGSDTYLRQTFQQGYMIWDATIGVIIADICL